MSRILSFAMIILLNLVLLGCAVLKTPNSNRISLDAAEKLTPGATTRGEVERLLGQPNQQVSLNQKVEGYDGTAWIYLSNGATRLTVYFKGKSTIVSSVGWSVLEGDPERSLEWTKQHLAHRFNGLRLVPRDEGWTNPHAYSDLRYYEDLPHAVVVFYRTGREEVAGISWSVPEEAKRIRLEKPSKKSVLHCLGGICYQAPGREVSIKSHGTGARE